MRVFLKDYIIQKIPYDKYKFKDNIRRIVIDIGFKHFSFKDFSAKDLLMMYEMKLK